MKTTTVILSLLTYLMLAGSAFAQDAPSELESEFETLNDEFTVVWRKWRQKKFAAQRTGVNEKVLNAIMAEEPTPQYIPRFAMRAERHTGTDRAIPYLSWLLSWGGEKAAHQALDQLVRDHIAHPSMARVVFSIALKARRNGFDRDKTLSIQLRIADATKDPGIRAKALFWRSYVIAGTPSTGSEKQQSLQDLATAMELGDARTKQDAEGLLFELQHLQIGMVAPDIEGTDLDGVGFKLSDYRNKVVMLDFWGDW
ncbi:MAG: hypothetical protein ACI89X_001952 [Planctomycetota bacterium]|jgi:hypothetical protein